MSVISKLLIEFVTEPLGLPIEWWKGWLIMLVVGEIAYRVAYAVVGHEYRAGGITTKTEGILLHLLIRLPVYVCLWAVSNGVIRFRQFVGEYWVIVFVSLGVCFIAVIAAVILIRKERKGGVKNA